MKEKSRRNNEFLKNYLQLIILIMIGIFLPTILIITQLISVKWMVYGPLTWLIALFLKIFVLGGVHSFIEKYIKNKFFISILWGMQSALAELGITIYFFYIYWSELNLKNILSFGIGIGIIEIFYVIGAVFLEVRNKEEDIEEALDWFVTWSSVFERIYTLFGHVFSRGIIWIAMLAGTNYFLILIAFSLFSIVDGIAIYGVNNNWNFMDPLISRKFHVSMTFISLIEGLLFFILIKLNNLI